jgi:cyclophilin family peptidyl-prolyl cis-trans isomerase
VEHLNKNKTFQFAMPRSRRFRKSDSKPEWGKNDSQTKAKNRKLMIIIGMIAVALVVLATFFVLNQNGTSPIQSQPTVAPTPAPTLPAYGNNDTKVMFMIQGVTGAGLSFSGNITIELRQDRPQTTSAFLKLVNSGFYDGSTFHRVIADFMIQGGKNSSAPQPPTIPDEAHDNKNNNTIGTIAMANTGQINSARNEFFINVANNNDAVFNYDYTVFGKVIDGMNVVNTIAATPVKENPEMIANELSMPLNATVIVKAFVLLN